MTQQPRKLLDQVRACPELVAGMQFRSRAVAGQCKHHAYRSKRTYVYWAKPPVLYHRNRHRLEMGEKENRGFPT